MIRGVIGAAFLETISAKASLDKGLVFYLTFDNVKGQTIIDESGNGLDAEILENAEIVKGKYGNAIHLTGQGKLRQYSCSGEIESCR